MKKLVFMFVAGFIWSSGSRADTPSVHGMLLFGGKSTYASHLPMFHKPHNYQVLMKVSLHEITGSKAVANYENAKKTSVEFFTMEPEVMDLSKVIDGTKTNFLAKIYQGHFERGGINLGVAQIQVEKMIFSNTLNSQTQTAENKFLVFGNDGEYFAAHLIKGKPSYDAILTVDQPYKLISSFCRTRACSEPGMQPISDSLMPVILSAQDMSIPKAPESLGSLPNALADIKNTIYVEEGDLAD